MRWLVTSLSLTLAAVAGCYAPAAVEGLPCTLERDCPSGQTCDEGGLCWSNAAPQVDASTNGIDANVEVDAAIATADATPACGYACTIDVAAGTSDCAGPVTVDLDPARGRAQLDLGDVTELELTFETCAPTGWSLHLADSPSCDGYSGDGGQFSNDAEVQLLDTAIAVYASGDGGSGLIDALGDAVVAGACSTSTWHVGDQRFEVEGTGFALASAALLRIDPPTDGEGAPDALWFLGLNRTFGSLARVGTGLTTVAICLR